MFFGNQGCASFEEKQQDDVNVSQQQAAGGEAVASELWRPRDAAASGMAAHDCGNGEEQAEGKEHDGRDAANQAPECGAGSALRRL